MKFPPHINGIKINGRFILCTLETPVEFVKMVKNTFCFELGMNWCLIINMDQPITNCYK